MGLTLKTRTREKQLPFLIILLPALVLAFGCKPSSETAPAREDPKPREEEKVSGETAQSPFHSRNVNNIIAPSGAGGVIYAGVAGQGVFKSSDNGISWEEKNKGLRSIMIFNMVFPPVKPDTLYLGTMGNGVFRSRDGGDSWEAVNTGLTNTTIEGLAVHPEDPGLLLAATTDSGLFLSRNGGDSWTNFNQGLPAWEHNNLQSFLLFAPEKPGKALYGNYNGLFTRTIPGPGPDARGNGWEPASSDLEGESVSFIYRQPGTPNIFLATKSGKILKSTGDFSAWETMTEELKNAGIYSLNLSHSSPPTLFAAAGTKGLLFGKNEGRIWDTVNFQLRGLNVRSVWTDPLKPERLFIGTKNKGLWISENSGLNWKEQEEVANLDWVLLMEKMQPPRPQGDSEKNSGVSGIIGKALEKCNSCHGWDQPDLNTNWHTLWYVTPTSRDWTGTVRRMKDQAKLTDEEERELVGHLNTHYGIP